MPSGDSVHDPGLARAKQRLELALPKLRNGLLELVRHLLVVGRRLDVAEDPNRRRAARVLRQPRKRETERRLVEVRVVDERLALAFEHLQRTVTKLPHALLAVLAEANRLIVFEVDPIRLVVAHEVERAVVEDVAVLEDLHERGAA